MEKQVIVTLLGAKPYDFIDEKTGRNVKGCTVFFHEEKPQKDDYGVGFLPKKTTFPYENYNKFVDINFPSKATPEMETRFTSKGAMTKIVDFKPLKTV